MSAPEVEAREGYARLLWLQLRTSFALAMQYRADFMTDGLVEVAWTATTLAPLSVLYGHRAEVAGWSYGEMLLVTAFFTLLQAVLEGAINPSMTLVVEQIRQGTFDFVLLKPKDAQFLVATARVLPWRALNVVTAAVLIAYGFSKLGRTPALADAAIACVFFGASLAILQSLWMLSVCLAFYVVKVDNLTYLFGSVFDAARWPSSVFKGALRLVFTFVIPLAIMTTFPAEALLGRAGVGKLALAVAIAAIAVMGSRAAWKRALMSYTSASS
jgi:ABC-2 type transport system permease protein